MEAAGKIGASRKYLSNDRYTLNSGHWDGRVVNGRKRPKADIGGRLPICHPASILRPLATPIRPNPPKGGDGRAQGGAFIEVFATCIEAVVITKDDVQIIGRNGATIMTPMGSFAAFNVGGANRRRLGDQLSIK